MTSKKRGLHSNVLPDLLKSGQFSDLTVKCNSKSFKVHRCIVCPQSAFFSKALNGEFKEASSQVVDLHDDDPLIVEKMLCYLYEGDYEDDPPKTIPKRHKSLSSKDEKSTPETAAHINARMYNIGDKYVIQGLMDLAKSKFESVIANGFDDTNFISIMAFVYSTDIPGGSGLRDFITKHAVERLSSLKDRPELLEVLQAQPDLTFELLQVTMKRVVVLETEQYYPY